jgi:outer membrane biosynthesis protein TonB
MTEPENLEPQGTSEPLLGSSFRRTRKRGPGAGSLIGSVLLHGGVIAAALGVGQITQRAARDDGFKVYRVSIVSPPPQVEGVYTPAPPKPAVVEAPRPAAPKPQPKPQKKTATQTKTAEPTTQRKPKDAPIAGRNPKPGSVGGEGLNINIEGEDFPYPEYLEGIIRGINAYFRWTGDPNLETEVAFYIEKDGSVKGIQTRRRSGNINFDFAAIAAIEEAGKRGRFGPLPRDFGRDRLGVQFTFIPSK